MLVSLLADMANITKPQSLFNISNLFRKYSLYYVTLNKTRENSHDTEYLCSVEKELKPIIKDKITINYSSNRYFIELNKIGVTKGNTMLQLAKIPDVAPEEIIAVGDNYNDLSMLEKAGLSITPSNTVKDIKEQCDYICKNNNNTGVITEVMENFFDQNHCLKEKDD